MCHSIFRDFGNFLFVALYTRPALQQPHVTERERNKKTCLAIDARAREKFKYVCIYAHIFNLKTYYCIVLFPLALRYES